ncbi:MAG: hypothetical protein ACK4UU_01260, partial [Fimbriimonadales bacterium]
MLWLSLALTTIGVLGFGWALTRRWATASPPPSWSWGRVARRLKGLLWLSIVMKAGVGVLGFGLGVKMQPPEAAFALMVGAGLTLLEFGLVFWWVYPCEKAHRGVQASLREYLQGRLRLVWDALAPILAVGLGALTLSYTLSGEYRSQGAWGALTAGVMGISTLAVGLGIIWFPT